MDKSLNDGAILKGDYKYYFGCVHPFYESEDIEHIDAYSFWVDNSSKYTSSGWLVEPIDKTKTLYEEIEEINALSEEMEEFNGFPIIGVDFRDCKNLTIAPTIPETAVQIVGCFAGCTSLKVAENNVEFLSRLSVEQTLKTFKDVADLQNILLLKSSVDLANTLKTNCDATVDFHQLYNALKSSIDKVAEIDNVADAVLNDETICTTDIVTDNDLNKETSR